MTIHSSAQGNCGRVIDSWSIDQEARRQSSVLTEFEYRISPSRILPMPTSRILLKQSQPRPITNVMHLQEFVIDGDRRFRMMAMPNTLDV